MDCSKLALFLLSSLLLVSVPFHQCIPFALAKLLPVAPSDARTQVYIVHVQHPNRSTELLSAVERDEWYHSFLPNSTLDSGDPRMVYTYAEVISGFAALLTPKEAAAMESMDGFVYSHPETTQPLHTTYTPSHLGLNKYDSLWHKSNQGEGIIIGVMDTGIPPKHSSFVDSLGLPEPPLKWRGSCHLPAGFGDCNNKLIGAQQFTGNGTHDTPIDKSGHGTHVAGIAVGSPVYCASVNGLAKGTASGMAPRAHLSVYTVCVKKGCASRNSLKGIEQAILDGVDIIQISNGKPEPFQQSGNIAGSYRAMKKGILTVCSAGNQGPSKGYVCNDAPWILTVGAATTDRKNVALLKLNNGMEFIGETGYQKNSPDIADIPLIFPRIINGSRDLSNVTGKIVICEEIFGDLVEVAASVNANGGAAVVFLNIRSNGNTLLSKAYDVPAIHVTYKDSNKIKDYITADPNPIGSIKLRGTEFEFRPSPAVASFSSRGPSSFAGNILKPDVIAPGASILSAWPFPVGPNATTPASETFNFESGTSMAAPHVSGIAALLKKSHPDWTPAMIKSAIMTTSYTADRDGNPFADDGSPYDDPADAFARGSGYVNPSAANDPGLVYDIPVADYLAYLCGLKLSKNELKAIAKTATANCTTKLASEDLNYPSIMVAMGAKKRNRTVSRTVTNVGEANSSYTAKVIEPKGVKVDVNPKTLHFASVGEEKSFTVELSLTWPPLFFEVSEGRLKWVSGNHEVSSPIVVPL